jgi:Cu+-exporting ATPase
VSAEQTCIHCGADCGKTPIIRNNSAFCCNGCEQVYLLLNEFKLDQYYTLTKMPGVKVDDVGHHEKYAFLDKEEVKEKLYEFHENDIAKSTFYIAAIHCISCIWLLEHLNRLNPGIKHSSVNFIEKTFTVSFNTSEISLRQLVELLVSIHYVPEISLKTLDKKDPQKGDKKLLYKIGVAGFIFGNVMLFSLPQYFNGKPLGETLGTFLNYFSLILTIPLVFYSGSDYLIAAFKNLKKKIIVIDLPIALGILALFIVTLYDVISGTGQGYSDSLSGLLFFLLIGKWYQSKTYQALSFDRDYKSYFPVAVTKVTEEGPQSILLKEISVGDRLLIRNKELIPSDSILISGDALVDYSFVTGESTPVKKETGEFLYAGGVQIRGAITIEVTREINQSHLTRLWNQSEEQDPTAKTLASAIDRLSGYFTLGVIGIALAGFAWWMLKGDLRTAILVFTSVLIVTCPCALALSQPFTFGNAMRMLGLNGMYLKNANVIEKLTRIDTVVLDKTGTITIPDANTITYDGERLSDEDIRAVVSMTKQSTHPLSNAIANHYKETEPLPTEGFVEVPGRGIFAKINGSEYKIGSEEYVSNNHAPLNKPSSAVFISIGHRVKGYFTVGNKYRPGVEQVMKDLVNHFDIYLLSGDNDLERETLRQYFRPEALLFEQKPKDKMDFILGLRKKGHNVLMTGDGLNDAGAFMQSNVGLSIADDIYHFSPAGDAIIESSAFGKLYLFIAYARKSLTVVKLSFVISFFYNVIGLIFALSGTLSPVVGAILMPISSVSVVAFATVSTRMLAGTLSK